MSTEENADDLPKKVGRKPGITQTSRLVKIDNELISRMEGIKNKNGFINQAIREKLDREDRKKPKNERPGQ